MVSRTGRGSLYQGSCTPGIQKALTGRVTTELGINLKAMTLCSPSLWSTTENLFRISAARLHEEEPCKDSLYNPEITV